MASESPTTTTHAVAPSIAVVVVAAGSGQRVAAGAVQDGPPKQYRCIGGRMVLARTLARLAASPLIGRVVTVIHPDHADFYAAASAGIGKLAPPVAGGATRQASVLAGLEVLAALAEGPPDLVLIHDAARPFIAEGLIIRLVAALAEAPAVLAAVPVADTLKRANDSGLVIGQLDRAGLWAAQTPQGFRFELILKAHRRAAEAGRSDFTDDAALAEWVGAPVTVVMGDPANAKITTPEDLIHADRRARMEDFHATGDIRVGSGYDVHAFAPGDHVTLCGVQIASVQKLSGHSDADVALHALTDAILGALGDGDIGQHFPPSDPRWKGCDSAVFLRDAAARLRARGGVLAHADISIIAEAPKIAPHREAMRAKVAGILGIGIDRVGVKATTNEKLGFVGRREGIAALATATVRLPWS
jgi:2-C-methyl-D-erythritol 4-phosphate cytidylyltransferase/2-C-methyl-D-erythritol 2,4-cyclodiphosphate synthase